jgi:hypothetical protein
VQQANSTLTGSAAGLARQIGGRSSNVGDKDVEYKRWRSMGATSGFLPVLIADPVGLVSRAGVFSKWYGNYLETLHANTQQAAQQAENDKNEMKQNQTDNKGQPPDGVSALEKQMRSKYDFTDQTRRKGKIGVSSPVGGVIGRKSTKTGKVVGDGGRKFGKIDFFVQALQSFEKLEDKKRILQFYERETFNFLRVIEKNLAAVEGCEMGLG